MERTCSHNTNDEFSSGNHDKSAGFPPSFDEVWEKYIMPLKGKTVTNRKLANTILAVTREGIIRITSTGSTGKIGIEGFKFAYDELKKKGEITRDYINRQVGKRCSSGIVIILSQIPFVEATYNPKGLKLNKI